MPPTPAPAARAAVPCTTPSRFIPGVFGVRVLSGMCRTMPYMDKRVEVRCSEVEIEAWRGAAGEVPLSRWVRNALNAAAASPPGLESFVVVSDTHASPEPGAVVVLGGPKFRPDFGGKLPGSGRGGS